MSKIVTSADVKSHTHTHTDTHKHTHRQRECQLVLLFVFLSTKTKNSTETFFFWTRCQLVDPVLLRTTNGITIAIFTPNGMSDDIFLYLTVLAVDVTRECCCCWHCADVRKLISRFLCAMGNMLGIGTRHVTVCGVVVVGITSWLWEIVCSRMRERERERERGGGEFYYTCL